MRASERQRKPDRKTRENLHTGIVFINLYSAAHSNGYLVALPVREPLGKKVLRRERGVGRDPERMITRREEGRHFIGWTQ